MRVPFLNFAILLLMLTLARCPVNAQVPAKPADPSQPMPALPVIISAPVAKAVAAKPLKAIAVQPGAVDNNPPGTKSITIVADPSLKRVMADLVQDWADSVDDKVQVIVQFANSGVVTDKLPGGTPWDLVISSDIPGMQELTSRGLLVHDGQQTLARNQIEIMGRHPLIPDDDLSWEELIRKEWRHVVIANPETSQLGKAAEFALKKHDLVDEDRMKEQFKLVANDNMLIPETMKTQSDAVFVYQTDAQSVTMTGFEPFPITGEDALPVLYVGAMTSTAKENQLCSDFITYCLSDKARETWKKYGFQLP